MPKKVIVIVGPIAAGKGTLVNILKEKGYLPYSFSDRIKEEITKRGLEVDRFSLNKVSNELRQTQGPDVLAKLNAEAIDRDKPELVVADGARNTKEVEYLIEKYGAEVFGITADQNTRFERLKARGLVNEDLTFEQFKELDDRENSQTDENSQQVGECMKLADVTLDNNGTVERLKEKVDEII